MKKILSIYNKYEEIINYIIIGGCTTLISLMTYYICVGTFLDADNAIQLQIANIVSWFCGLVFAYITNRKIVFKSNNNNIKKECLKFTASRTFTLLFDMLFMFVTVSIFKLDDRIYKIASNVIVIVLNYLMSKFIIFVKK